MDVDILTLFPRFLDAPLAESMLRIARQKGILRARAVNLRDFAHDRRRTVDDRPYGGGPGMVLRPEPVFEAVEALRRPESRVILLTPQGRRFCQAAAEELARQAHLILICGAYEGIDERVREHLVDEEVSIGDYVLTNGTLPALVLLDAVTRLLPGVLGDAGSLVDESFSQGRLEHPHYTRPGEFRGWRVPDVLAGGDHAEISRWRRAASEQRTRCRRPELLT